MLPVDVFEKYKNYVVFTALKKDLLCTYVMYDHNYVAVYTNRLDMVKVAFDNNYLFESCDHDKIIGIMTVIYEEHLFENRYCSNTYKDSEPVLKTHPMYVEGVGNSFFEIGNLEIHIFHYPNEIVNINNKKSFEYCSFVGKEEDIVRELLCGYKKILARYNHLSGTYSIHGAAVSDGEKGFLFLSGSRVGKSTLFLNLIASGYYPLNDDIIFWEKGVNKEIFISGCATLPQLRKGTFENIVPVLSLQQRINSSSLEDDELMRHSYSFFERKVDLHAIIIPELGHKKCSIIKIDNASALKKELRACMVHGNYDVDEKYLNSIKALNSIPTYKIHMSKNYVEICDMLQNFFEGLLIT